MELADPRMIAELLESAQRPQRRNVKNSMARVEKVLEAAARPTKAKQCRCGHCRVCMENLRWDRIFNEKFADPGYYSTRLVRFDSPLS